MVNYFYPRWGSEHIAWDDFLFDVKKSGYNGVEIGIPEGDRCRTDVLSKIDKYDLKFIAQHWETNDSDFQAHKASFSYHLDRLARIKPYLINSHTGKDYFTKEQNIELLQIADDISYKYGVCITHETHRGRSLFAPHITQEYLKDFAKLKLTLDVSHWICVAESLLYDQQNVIDSIAPSVVHIHARFGHTEGPQIYSPGLEIWKETCDRHFQIWDQIINIQTVSKKEDFAITVESGPFPYMPILNGTDEIKTHQRTLNNSLFRSLKSNYLSDE